MMKPVLTAALVLLAVAPVVAQEWTVPLRGSWVRTGPVQPGDVTLARGGTGCEIVVAPEEEPPVRQAARFLAADIEKLSGYRPPIVARRSGGRVAVVLTTPPDDPRFPFTAAWESYKINTGPNEVRLAGSDARGTAFAAYTLSERLGIDPLYLWTGYKPERRDPLVLKKASLFVKPPTFKFRGMFHDDEDILPRPFDPRNGYPYGNGVVSDAWYERFFETALRLRMNMVAPWTRVNRRFRIQKMASDWGLFYTSHHYDILLSDPYGYDRFGKARARGVEGAYDYINNHAGMLKYWRAGVLENGNLDAVYPVGLRGTDDYGYRFPKDATAADKAKIYGDAIREQVDLAKETLPPGKPPYFALTLYGEMLDNYLAGDFNLPEDVMLVWADDGMGTMRGLPKSLGRWKQGVYYHLAYFYSDRTTQSVRTCPPGRITTEFKKIRDSGATTYMLVNVSELREYVLGARMLADICWDTDTALSGPDPTQRWLNWWSREYFGADAAPFAADAYNRYAEIVDSTKSVWYGSDQVHDALLQLMKKVNGEEFTRLPPETVAKLKERLALYEAAMPVLDKAERHMTPAQRQFFHENVRLGLSVDHYPTRAALLLEQALETPDNEQSMALVRQSLAPLRRMEADIQRAERPPFENWYRATWIRPADFFNGWSDLNVRRPLDEVQLFLHGRQR